tara:strand:- start:18 stop:233 length:216 start_codon:yes stop_codon:yes gene_type:complete
MRTQAAEYKDWHAWNANRTQWLLSHESTKHLTTWSSVDDLINYLWSQDIDTSGKEAARVFNKKFKGKEVKK